MCTSVKIMHVHLQLFDLPHHDIKSYRQLYISMAKSLGVVQHTCTCTCTCRKQLPPEGTIGIPESADKQKKLQTKLITTSRWYIHVHVHVHVYIIHNTLYMHYRMPILTKLPFDTV